MTPTDEDAGFEQDALAEDSLRALGVADEQLAAGRDGQGPAEAATGFEVWRWHRDAMRLYGGMRTQWLVASGMGGIVYLGLNYVALPPVMRLLGLYQRRNDTDLFEQLQVMERAALKHLNRVDGTDNSAT